VGGVESFKRLGAHSINGARWVVVRTGRSDAGVILTVEDSGYGIAERNLDRVFEPFFTTKREGLGIFSSHHKTSARRSHRGSTPVLLDEVTDPTLGHNGHQRKVWHERSGWHVTKRYGIAVSGRKDFLRSIAP